MSESSYKLRGVEGEIISIDEIKSYEFKIQGVRLIGARRWRRLMRAFWPAGTEWRRTGAGLKPWHRRRLGLDTRSRRLYRVNLAGWCRR